MAPRPRVIDPSGARARERATADPAHAGRPPPYERGPPVFGEGGVNNKVVQERLGHHLRSFTADTYQHVFPGMDEATAGYFDQLVFGDAEGDEATAQSLPQQAQRRPVGMRFA